MKHTNDLIQETSPYLLQHANNPVHWRAWKPEILAEAKKRNKPLLVSIGYSSCHWCHVMAHESFEDETIAAIMNENFVCVKVDREERPDVDQIYMNALQLMTGRGGWPLNIVALPDGRPIWGGTYLPKDQWAATLRQLGDLYEQAPNELLDYAEKLTKGIQTPVLVPKKSTKNFDPEIFIKILSKLKPEFDTVWGGTKGAPKFMMPDEQHFLLRYAHQTKDEKLMEHVILTLDRMSFGGIFDQLGGGFSRYSTDEKWHVPHFEKMLYDNAQLVSLYCDAFLLTKNPWYEKVVKSTLEFVNRELSGKTGNFFCALDADSSNEKGTLEEGAYYVWKKAELQKILKEDFQLFAEYFNINETGYWENGKYILMRTKTPDRISENHGIFKNELNEKIEQCSRKLLEVREKRAPPGLDDKSLTSWNAMMLKAFLDAYRVFGETVYLEIAVKNAAFLESQFQENTLFHSFKNGKKNVNGFLDDHAFSIEAFIALYENTFDEKYMHFAKKLTELTLENFYDEEKHFFYFTSKKDHDLIARPVEFQDNVVPSSNSVMAKNLFRLSHFFNHSGYHKISEEMLKTIFPQLENYPQAYFNWLALLMDFTFEFYEVAILGENAENECKEINQNYLPNKILAGNVEESNLPLLKNRWKAGETWLYVCVDQTCERPVNSSKKALELML